MANKRKQIEMSEEEILTFLDEEKVAIVTSFGPRGWPHSMPLWYVVEAGRIRTWTFRKSQKVKNLERDPRATVLVEAGYDRYEQLRGVMYEAETVIHDDPETVLDYAAKVSARYSPDGSEPTPEMIDAFRQQAPKRVVLEFQPVRTVSWDHRKLGGAY
ncbi:MAG: pyridoxamine 5'-phosphate oxidase family protein [Solirubrobacterales bacterium]|nr:pyridoxamine 5'-phosphate oxidase family protein [Solirubrobacterales bacterium]OJU96175.1 MAG: pyridoxamine 5'-phosphate oxidase [Solirubrobacterales bacterium 67-14]